MDPSSSAGFDGLPREFGGTMLRMKEDVLEQVAEDYLQMRDYFTRHNLRFKPGRFAAATLSRIRCPATWTLLGSIRKPEASSASGSSPANHGRQALTRQPSSKSREKKN